MRQFYIIISYITHPNLALLLFTKSAIEPNAAIELVLVLFVEGTTATGDLFDDETVVTFGFDFPFERLTILSLLTEVVANVDAIANCSALLFDHDKYFKTTGVKK